MVEDHMHGPDGHVIPVAGEMPEAEPEIVVDNETDDNDVKIARIEADTAIKLAKIDKQAAESEDVTEIEALKAELRAMHEMLGKLMPAPDPEPEPEPVIVPDPGPGPEAIPEPPVAEEPKEEKPRSKKHRIGLW